MRKVQDVLCEKKHKLFQLYKISNKINIICRTNDPVVLEPYIIKKQDLIDQIDIINKQIDELKDITVKFEQNADYIKVNNDITFLLKEIQKIDVDSQDVLTKSYIECKNKIKNINEKKRREKAYIKNKNFDEGIFIDTKQ